MNIHLIDGTYELYRAFYGAPKATNSQDKEVGAARGLMRSLAALLREPDCTHVAIAFDSVIESFRNDMFGGYKTGDGIDPDLWSQFPLAEQVAEALGVVVWPMRDFEADDALATAAARWSKVKSVDRVYLCSPDKDLAQCVQGDRVVLWDRMRHKVLGANEVREKWGVSPSSIPDYLGLVGDAADGIPGIPRWGAKSSSVVLAAYETIEAIPDDHESWSVSVRGASSLAANLAQAREDALLYKRLATLRTDVPLEQRLSDLAWKGAYRGRCKKLASEVGDTRILDRIERWRDD